MMVSLAVIHSTSLAASTEMTAISPAMPARARWYTAWLIGS